MAILRRAPREVYRVYGEAEYLAGADALGEWHKPGSRRPPQGHPLRRLGVAGALTGALGALGGVIVLAGIGVRSPNRLLAANGTFVKGGVLVGPGELDGTTSAGRDRVRLAIRMRHTRAGARRGVGRWARSRLAVSARATRSASARRAAGCAPGVQAEPVGAAPAVAYARADPGEREARSPTQSEFGFER
jgi:hypothetical protein